MINISHLRGPLGFSIVSITFIGAFCVYGFTTVISPLRNWSTVEVSDEATSLMILKHDELVAVDLARFNGRSAFFKPIPIPKPPPEKKDDVGDVGTPPPPSPPPPPPPPSVYSGPPLIAIIGNEAWFRGSGSGFRAVIRLKIGEESNGLTLVSTAAPSLVTVKYLGGEYPINLFDSEEPFFREDPPLASSPSFLEEVN